MEAAEIEASEIEIIDDDEDDLELSESEQEELRQLAYQLEVQVKDAIGRGREAMWDLASALYEFNEHSGWVPLGYESQGEWLAQPEIGMSKRQYHRLVRLHRETVVMRQISTDRVKELEPSKVEIVLPWVESGKKSVDDAFEDARSMGTRDLREVYIGPQGTPRPARESTPDATGKTAQGTDAKPEKAARHRKTDDNGQPEEPAWVRHAQAVDSYIELGGRKDKARRDWAKFVDTYPVIKAIALVGAFLDGGLDEAGETIRKDQAQEAWTELVQALSLPVA